MSLLEQEVSRYASPAEGIQKSETINNTTPEVVDHIIRIDENALCLVGEWDHDRTCNVFIIGRVLFDMGALTFPYLWQNYQDFVNQSDVVRDESSVVVFITHPDFDHIHNAPHFQNAVQARGNDVLFFAPEGSQAIINTADPVETAQHLYAHHQGATLQPFEISAELVNGAAIEVGQVRVHCVSTPGHAPNHMSYIVIYQEKMYLVPGDLLGGLGEGRGGSLEEMLMTMKQSAIKYLHQVYQVADQHLIHLDDVLVLESHGYPDHPTSLAALERQVSSLADSIDMLQPGFRGVFLNPILRTVKA